MDARSTSHDYVDVDDTVQTAKGASALLNNLNEAQRAAVESIDRPTLVVSPAGTGKTEVLTKRYLRMLERGSPTNKLLAITFSRRAAGEMRARVAGALEGVDERDVFIDTFHSLGSRILRSMPSHFGLTDRFRVADEDEGHRIMREAVLRVDADSLDGPFGSDRIKRLAELLDQIKNEGLTPSMVADRGYRFKNTNRSRDDIEILEEYETQMRLDNVVDYNDLILKPLMAFDSDPKLALAWRRQFDAVMIDEYQDTNKTQYMLLRHLTEGQTNVLFLGDDDQLIFEWRGANNSYVIDFEQQWPNSNVIVLTINYRNGPEIVRRAKEMIDKNDNRRPKDMTAARTTQAVVEMRQFDEPREEQAYIARLIQGRIEDGVALDDIAVLTRTRTEAATIALSLAAHDIPCYYPDNDVLSFREVRALVSWMRLVVDDTDRLALMNAMATPNVGLTAAAIDKLNDWARTHEQTLSSVVREFVKGGKAQPGGPLEQFLKKLEAVQKIDINSPRAFEDVVRTIGLDEFAQASSPAAVEGLNNAMAIFQAAFEELGSVNAVMEAITVSAKSSLEARQGQARVRVDTMHASKGLEFSVVVASGWEEGHFPKKTNPGPQMEEDRRLAYVTFSRARDMFVATTCRRRSGGKRDPSRFLTELGLSQDIM